MVVLRLGKRLLGREREAPIETGANVGLNNGLFLVVRSVVVVVGAWVVAREVLANGFRRVVIVTDLCVAAGGFGLAPLVSGGLRTFKSGLLLRREFSVVVVTGSWLSLSISSDGSSVTNVVSNSSGSGVVIDA